LYNSTGLVNSTNYTTQIKEITWTSLPEGRYSYDASVYDLAGNFNSTEIRSLTLDRTAPTLDIIEPASNISTSNMTNYNVRANVNDLLSGVENVMFTLKNSTGDVLILQQMTKEGVNLYRSSMNLVSLPSGNYTIEINATDYAENPSLIESRNLEITDDVAQIGDITTINGQVSASEGGTVSFILPVIVRGNGTINFAMEDLAGFSPSDLNATISSGNSTAVVGWSINFIGSTPLTLNDTNLETLNIEGQVTLSLDIPGNNSISSGSYTIKYYIDN
jgi:hypothetical protein